MQTGSHERMLVSPLRRPTLIVGRALKEIVPMMVHSVIIIAVTIPFGFRPHIGAVLGLAVLAVMCVGLGALSYSLALASKNVEWSGGPAWLRFLSKLNPLTYLVNAERQLFSGQIFTGTVGLGLLAAVVVAALGLSVGTRLMRGAMSSTSPAPTELESGGESRGARCSRRSEGDVMNFHSWVTR